MLELKGNANYAAFVYEVTQTHPLDGLDNLVGINIGGYQALTSKTTQPGDLFIVVVAGTQISETYARKLNLYRDSSLNADPNQTGYLENNRRIKAIRLRGHASNALLIPFLEFVGVRGGGADLRIGMQFDHIDGVEFSRKFVVPTKGNINQPKENKKHKSGVTDEFFPQHYDTPQWHRVSEEFAGKDVTVTQKVHGTSVRFGWTLAERDLKWYERLAQRFGVKVSTVEDKFVVGSRRVIKTEGDGDHWYSTDIWSEFAQTHNLAEALPKNVVVYGELIGWLPTGEPIQKGYTYDLPKGQARLLVYRVTIITPNGAQYDLSDAAMREFAEQRGLKAVPLLASFSCAEEAEGLLTDWLAERTDTVFNNGLEYPWAVPLSPDSPCDEGVVIRAEGITPHVAKFKNPLFYEHESRAADRGEADIEDATS